MPQFPIELCLSLDPNLNEDVYMSQNVVQFFNLAVNQSDTDEKVSKVSAQKAKQIINGLNFIRFNYSSVKTVNDPPKVSNLSDTNNGLKLVPNFSLILLTNIPSTASSLNLNSNGIDASLHKNWSYKYKVELNDEHGRTLARQLFYKLNKTNHLNNFPLCCNTNWTSPLSVQKKITNKQKCIIRLNLNCKNYDLMLFFYRLLFSKYQNYSKKNFTLFILNQSEHKIRTDDGEEESITIEFQLSLKNDPNIVVDVNSDSKQPTSLVYNVESRESFVHMRAIFEGFCEEIVKNKVYLVRDPDQNKIYLNLISKNNNNPSSLFVNTVGLGDKYNESIMLLLRAKNNYYSNYSLNNNQNANLNSPSDTASYDSSKDSGNWSYTSLNNPQPRNNYNFDYRELHALNGKNNNIVSKQSNFLATASYENCVSVRNLINKFDSKMRLTQRKMSKNLKQNSEEDDYEDLEYDEVGWCTNTNSDGSDKSDNLNLIMKKAINGSMHALNDLKSNSNLKNSSISRRMRSSSALNDPNASNFQYQKASTKFNSSTKNGGVRSSLKKSKSVTFLDSIDQLNLLDKRCSINEEFNRRLAINSNNVNRERSKSTVPFMHGQYDDDDDGTYVIATVDDTNILNSPAKSNYVKYKNIQKKYKNCLIEPKSYSMSNTYCAPTTIMKKPNVGLTPETRLRQTPTLNMVRNSCMPLNTGYSTVNMFYQNNNSQWLNNSNFNVNLNQNNSRNYGYHYPVAKF
jgi:hypothetical protein